MKKGFDSEENYNEKYVKTKIKPYEGKTNTKRHDNVHPKIYSNCICERLILIDSILKTGKNYYLEAFFWRM